MDTMTGLKRTNYCGDLCMQDVGKAVTVCGWVQRQRDLGALLIIGGSALMSMGYLQTTGFYNVSCPQCGAQGTLSPRARVWKCPQCKCRSLRQGDALEEE